MLDYKQKIKELQDEIKQLELEVTKLELDREFYIKQNKLQLRYDGGLSRLNGLELNRPAIKMRRRIYYLKERIACKYEQIEKLEWLIRASYADGLFLYAPDDYYVDVIIRDGCIKVHKF